MGKRIDLEREFYIVARDLKSEKEARKKFVKRIKSLSEEWIDNKYRLGVMKTKMLIKRGRKELDYTTTEYRFLDDIKSSSAVTNIYGDKVCILIWTDEPEGIIIENGAVAKAYKSYFDFMWKFAKKK